MRRRFEAADGLCGVVGVFAQVQRLLFSEKDEAVALIFATLMLLRKCFQVE
jgi:hypothetical protein